MKSSKKEKVHDWVFEIEYRAVVDLEGKVTDPGFYLYRCKKCGFKIKNGEPIPMPQREECG